MSLAVSRVSIGFNPQIYCDGKAKMAITHCYCDIRKLYTVY